MLNCNYHISCNNRCNNSNIKDMEAEFSFPEKYTFLPLLKWAEGHCTCLDNCREFISNPSNTHNFNSVKKNVKIKNKRVNYV